METIRWYLLKDAQKSKYLYSTKQPNIPKQKGVPYDSFLKVRNLYLDSPTLDVCARFKRLDGILDGKPMSNQLSNAGEHTRIDEANSLGPGIGISILELEVDLARREAHERELHFVLPDADHKNGPSKPHSKDCSGKRALHARTLERDVGFEPTKGGLDPLRNLLGRSGLYKVSGEISRRILGELLRKVQPALINVGNNDRLRAGGLGAE